MQTPSFPRNEKQRLHALCELNVLDTSSEERFDRLTRIAQRHFKVPIVLVSLVDAARQWFKSRQGLSAIETPRNISFCGHAILSEDILYVPNALEDPRFFDNPLVTEAPHIRFYAGAPLSSVQGFRVGTLCLIDTQARELSPVEFETLRDLANCVEQELQQMSMRQAMEAINEHKSHLQAVLDTVVDGIVTIDEQGKVLSVNPATEKIFGYPAHQLIGKNVKQLMPDNYAREHDAYLYDYCQTGEAKVIGIGREVMGRHQNGHEFPMELAVSEMWQGSRRYFVGVVRDISERKKVDRMKSEFVSTVSHELRTPLTSIRGSLDLVLGKAREGLPPKVVRLLETAQRNSERLTLLINDILDLEKIESGCLEFEFSAQDLLSLSHQALEANEGYAHKYNVQLHFNSTLSQAVIWGDAHRLLQVFTNLMSNAIKYSSPTGTVDISVQEENNRYRVSVRDYGAGIPEAFRGQIFQRFAQADSSDSREKGGTGLGLSIVKAIIERHDGHIDYQSIDDEPGTEFYFTLPRWHEVLHVNTHDAGPAQVLICEDNADVSFVLSHLLEQEGLFCDIATTASSAKTLLSENDYRLLLLDLTLPDADGIEFLRELRTIKSTETLPVIIISGQAEKNRTQFKGDALMVVDWLQKPIDNVRLFNTVNGVLRGSQRVKVLHIEDNPDILQLVTLLLEETADIDYAMSLKQARIKMENPDYDLVILDLNLPDGSGLELLEEAQQKHLPVVVFSADTADVARDKIASALTKSKTSNEELVKTIKSTLNRCKEN